MPGLSPGFSFCQLRHACSVILRGDG